MHEVHIILYYVILYDDDPPLYAAIQWHEWEINRIQRSGWYQTFFFFFPGWMILRRWDGVIMHAPMVPSQDELGESKASSASSCKGRSNFAKLIPTLDRIGAQQINNT